MYTAADCQRSGGGVAPKKQAFLLKEQNSKTGANSPVLCNLKMLFIKFSK
jgi:hypothetical protein